MLIFLKLMINKEKIKEAIKLFLEGIGEDPNREGLKETPERVAKMWEEFEREKDFNFKLFEDYSSYSEMILIKDIAFYSLCEHHLLPFFGKAHVAYIPKNKICGLSKIVRAVRAISLRPQVQERMTEEIASLIENELEPIGIGVVIEAEHLCMSMRGVRSPGHKTITSSLRGSFLKDMKTREEFFKLIRNGN